VFHNSNTAWMNVEEHNFVKGFICSVGSEKSISTYPRRAANYVPIPVLLPENWLWFFYDQNPNVVTGENGCLALPPK
jgi:hypothetical protein